MYCNVLYMRGKMCIETDNNNRKGLSKVCTAVVVKVVVGIVAQVSKSWELFILFAHNTNVERR
jgi:hypothetical protein